MHKVLASEKRELQKLLVMVQTGQIKYSDYMLKSIRRRLTEINRFNRKRNRRGLIVS